MFVFEEEFYEEAQANLNSKSSCFSLPNAKTTRMPHNISLRLAFNQLIKIPKLGSGHAPKGSCFFSVFSLPSSFFLSLLHHPLLCLLFLLLLPLFLPLLSLSSFSIPTALLLYSDSDPSFHYRGRSPQPPAEEDEDDFDDTLVAIDTCEC